MTDIKKTLITSALPYINGITHRGETKMSASVQSSSAFSTKRPTFEVAVAVARKFP